MTVFHPLRTFVGRHTLRPTLDAFFSDYVNVRLPPIVDVRPNVRFRPKQTLIQP